MDGFSRRRLIKLLTAGGAVALAGCEDNAALGRRQLVVLSDEQLALLAEPAWADMKAQMPAARDAALQTRLSEIGRRVADASGLTNLNWEFVVFDNPEINAFVLPGGKVGFFSGLMGTAENDAEVAAVMGHEVGHVLARHAAERMTHQLAVQGAVIAAAIALGGSEQYGQYADQIAGALGAGLIYGVVMPYARTHELEADRLGVEVMQKADYPPQAALSFWERMTERGGPRPPELLSTHPSDERRLAVLREQVAAQA